MNVSLYELILEPEFTIFPKDTWEDIWRNTVYRPFVPPLKYEPCYTRSTLDRTYLQLQFINHDQEDKE